MNKSNVLRAACAATALIVALGCSTGGSGTDEPSQSPTAGPTFTTTLDSPAPSIAATPSPSIRQAITITDGIWQVPEDVKPGMYKTTVPADSWNCYYEVKRNFDDKIDSILTNGNQDAGKQVVMSIPQTAKGVELRGCGTWTKIK